MGRSKISKQSAKARAEEKKALELRRAGATYSQIAEQLGIGETSARRHVASAYKRLIEETNEAADEMRQLETDRLDAMLLSIWPRVRKGELLAIDRALKIHAARAKMYGIESAPMPIDPKPVQVTVVDPADEPDPDDDQA